MLAHAAAPATITKAQSRALKRWFLTYAAHRVRRYPRHRDPMGIKIAHSIRVSRICTQIGADLGLDSDRLRLAGTIGLLHDVARFEQLIRYGTFVDRVSVDHGALGADLLRKAALVRALTASDRAILIHAVRHHNAAAIPGESDPGISFYLQLVRDADKLDIYRVMCTLRRSSRSVEPAIEALDLSAAPEVTPTIAAAIEAGQIAPIAAVRTEADLLLARLAWVFDLHFHPSFKHLAKAGYISLLATDLPRTAEINHLLGMIRNQMERGMAVGA